jgi:GH25 family lysozyme M1 (1,4-beta-N-acetylmuramidase)
MIKAIDVSSWQHPGGAAIDFVKVKAAGYDGVWVKCSQGTNYVNPYFAGDVAAALEAGLVVGAYHFAEPWHNSPESEAAYAIEACAGHQLDLGLALDLENLGSMAPHEAGNWAPAFLNDVAQHHVLAPLYTDQSIFGQMPGAPFGFPLWIADPSGTFEGSYWAKQTGSGAVDGVQGSCDQDVITNVRGVNPSPPGTSSTPPVSSEPGSTTTTQQPPTGGTTAGGLHDVNVPTLSAQDPGPGTASPAVKALQVLLVDKWGADLSPAGIDGRFGPKTEDAVKWVQGEAQGRSGPVDGIVGPETWAYLVIGG